MPKALDITGQKFNKLTAIRPTNDRSDGKVVWQFLCDCGEKAFTTAKSAKIGNTKSCGCYVKESAVRKSIESGRRRVKNCLSCGKEIEVKASHFDRTRYCSKICYAEGLNSFFSGSKNPNWRGGISFCDEHKRNRAKKWRIKNLDKISTYNRCRKLRRRKAKGSHTSSDIKEIYELQKGMCAYCKKKVGKQYHVDHIIPISKGGSNDRANLCIACPTCNIKKRDKMPEVWANERGFLI